MAAEPWFKFYAADYLLDAGVDSLPLEARAVLLSMWCLCHIEGSCPADPEEIARKTRLPVSAVSRHQGQLARFFEERDGRLYSRRMEAEKRKSDIARRNGQKRGEQIRSANRSADGSADCLAQSQSQSQSQSQRDPPSLENQAFHSKEKQVYSQKDFDARDLRKMQEAWKKFSQMAEMYVGNQPDWMRDARQSFEWVCNYAGVTVERGLELEKLQKQWPKETPAWAEEARDAVAAEVPA